ncbi:lipocalin family protein [Robbsia andropogonis]|uniref:lipocalin family protein n=1 Tax=Robbsia andropogonis TaxID=28092 RepID=UPI002A6B660D|nr:lipocalin family protein [Robbsia andropogonis]
MFDRSTRARRAQSLSLPRSQARNQSAMDFRRSKHVLSESARPPYSPAVLGTAAFAALGLSGLAAYGAWRGWQSARPSGNRAVPQPVKPVDIARYAGRWYEWARYENRFEQGCERVTAEYRPTRDGMLRVVNTCGCHPDAPSAHRNEGKAKIVAGSRNAKLKVSFFGPFYLGNYWILDHDDDYQWSIVGEPSGRYLWLLTREAVPDEHIIAVLMSRVVAMGYDTTLLRLTMQ